VLSERGTRLDGHWYYKSPFASMAAERGEFYIGGALLPRLEDYVKQSFCSHVHYW
jgi:hypothetical protein